MTGPTEKQIEAAARALCRIGTNFPTPEQTASWVDEKWHRFKYEAETALAAALAVEAGADPITPHIYAQEYEFRSDDGDYTPTDGERAMIEDAIYSYLDVVEADNNIRSALTPASSAVEGEALRIADAVLAWMVKYDLLDAGNEYRAEDVVSVLNDLAPAPTPAGDGLQAAVDRWADALRKCETENTRSAGHALDAAEETLLSFASPAPHQEGRADADPV